MVRTLFDPTGSAPEAVCLLIDIGRWNASRAGQRAGGRERKLSAKSKRMRALTPSEIRTKGSLIHRSQWSAKKQKVRRIVETSSST